MQSISLVIGGWEYGIKTEKGYEVINTIMLIKAKNLFGKKVVKDDSSIFINDNHYKVNLVSYFY